MLTIEPSGHTLPPAFRSDISHLIDEGTIVITDVCDRSDCHETRYTVALTLKGEEMTFDAGYSFWGGSARLCTESGETFAEFSI